MFDYKDITYKLSSVKTGVSLRKPYVSLHVPLNKDTFSSVKKDILLKGKERIFACIEESIKNKQNRLGAGDDAVVYKLEKQPYCVRLLRHGSDDSCFRNYKKSISFDLTEADRINHIVANLGEGCSIMRNIEGYPLIIPPLSNCKIPQKEITDMVYKLPVSAYNKLFKQICHAKKHKMVFDCSGTNIIVNPKDKTLTAIDFYRMDPNSPKTVKPLTFLFDAIPYNTPQQQRKSAGMLILGALEELKPGIVPSTELSEFKFNDFFDRVERSMPRNLPSEWPKIKDTVTEIVCLKLKESIGMNVKSMQAYKFEEAEKIIKNGLIEKL